ncbi:MAG: hypothetical protein PHV37_08280 [Candidatus Gastranaerophilales bacterium]|nr:hypothetical protein [Candidatus Gastranaerophilales bacterium]
MEKKNLFVSFLDKFIDLPLWIKEALFLCLKQDLEKYSVAQKSVDKSDLYQFYSPVLTYVGKKEISSHNDSHEPNVYKFLEGAAMGLNCLEITLNNYWTLEETALLNILCVEKEYVSPPSSKVANAMLLYFSGKIRFGEYFKRIGKINVDQLDSALRKQKELEENGQKMGMASVMIKLGLVTEEDTKNVLYVKDESKKRFIFNTDLLGKGNASRVDSVSGITAGSNLALLEKLTKENTLLKHKIKGIINVIQGK